MIERAWLAQQSSGRLAREEKLVAEEVTRRGIPFECSSIKKLRRRQVPLSPQTLVVGDIDCLHIALQQLEVPIPKGESYPSVLSHQLHRRVWPSTFGEEEARFHSSFPDPMFIKPQVRRKLFTGKIVEREDDFEELSGISALEPVVCSDVVTWMAEYRVYVIEDEVRAVDHYAGDAASSLDLDVVREGIRLLAESGESYAGYGIDYGILESGQTALVELNDGFSLGAYSIDSATYTDLLIARWEELVRAEQL